ncbi:unnamed protein product, partial [Dicrocoelium dendriticum]
PSLYYPTTLVVSPAVSNHELCATNTLPVGENFTCPVSVTGVLLTQARSIANPGIQTSVPFYTAHLGSIQPQVGSWKLASNGNESANTAVAKASTSKTNCESDANKADQIKKPSVTSTQATPFTPISNTDLPGLQSTTTHGTHNELSCRLYNSCPPQILLRPSDVRFLDQAECSGKNSFQNKLPSTTAENQIKVSTIDSCCNSKSDGLRWQIPMHKGNHSTAQRNQSLLSLQQSSSFCSEHNSHPSIATSSDDPKLNIQVLTETRRAKTENVNMIPVDGLQTQPANQVGGVFICLLKIWCEYVALVWGFGQFSSHFSGGPTFITHSALVSHTPQACATRAHATEKTQNSSKRRKS